MSKAIVVGASSGIGLEVARLLIQRGWTVGVAARRVDLLNNIGAADVEMIDVTSANADSCLMSLIERMGGIDLFFYASGIGKQNRELAADIELATLQTNGVGLTRMLGAAYRYFAQQGRGHIADIRPGFVDTALLSGSFHYPMMLQPQAVARDIVNSIERGRHIRVIDWRYRILTALWRRIPRFIWRRLKL